jgi:post-segregation antitoxin (ccd killing protein)
VQTMATELDELRTLTPKQAAFVNGLLQGETAADAYREAYHCKNMSNATVWVEASRLRSTTKVSLWLRHFQRIGMNEARVTVEAHLAELARARELAYAHGQISAGVRAEHHRGKLAGLYKDRLEVTVSMSDAELIKALGTAFSKEAAEAIGAALAGLT